MMLNRLLQLVGGVGVLAVGVSVGGCGARGSADATDSTGRLLDAVVIGETGTHPGQFVYPRAMDVYVDDEGRTIAVVIDKTARMQAIDLGTGEMVGSVVMPAFSNGMPTGVTVGVSLLDGSKMAAYVPDTHEHRLLVYPLPLPEGIEDGEDVPAFSFGVFGQEHGEFVYPTDVVVRVDGDGAVDEILISEYGGNDRITKYAVVRGDEIGLEWEGQIGMPSETVDGSDGAVALSRPQSMGVWAHDGVEELIVADSSHHRVGRLTMDGGVIAWYGKDHDPAFATMGFPYGVTVLDDGSALISEFGGNVVRRMDLATGKTVAMFGVGGRGKGELATPWASAVVAGRLVILDSGNNRIQVVGFDEGVAMAGGDH
tara:strand:- start:289324 stop:290433 length:1110 start_codon:yes stop_codon:yes gene_type:complete